MAFFDQLNDKHRAFIAAQQMFFTASAPSAGGRINLSPKGIDGLRIIDDSTICYLDLTGSGNETAAHIRDNGRLTIMLCSFAETPLILRLYGRGRSVQPGDGDQWNELLALFPHARPGTRQIIVLHIDSVQTSCGFGVPHYEFTGQRDTLLEWGEKKGEEKVREYQRTKNVTSIDGLPTGMRV